MTHRAHTAGVAATDTRGGLLLYPLVAEAARATGRAGHEGVVLLVLERVGARTRARLRLGDPREGARRSWPRLAPSAIARDEMQEDLLKTKGFTQSRH